MAAGQMRPASIADLDDETLRRIFGPLSAADTAAGMAVGRQWRRSLGDQLLWWRLCQRDYGLGAFTADVSAASFSDAFDPSADYRAAYASWEAAYPDFRAEDEKPVLRRAAMVWKRLRAWFGAHHSAVLSTLQSPAAASELDALRAEINLPDGLPLRPSVRALYRVCNGQRSVYAARFDAWAEHMSGFFGNAPKHVSSRFGLLGGYTFYDMSVCSEMLPLSRAVARCLQQRKFSGGLQELLLPFAASGVTKLICVCCATGRVWCLDRERRTVPLCPEGKDVLDWLEEFAARLEAGAYSLAPQPLSPLGMADGHPDAGAVCLFPRTVGAGMRECLTGGVRVRVSPVWVPEQSLGHQRQRGFTGQFFAYSVRFYLLPAEEQVQQPGAGRAKASVQLESRHWVIRDAGGQETDRVDGAGVVGEQPILTPGGEEFVYQSVTQGARAGGSMEGSFTFVEGTLARPTGPPLHAVCPRFELRVPAYAF